MVARFNCYGSGYHHTHMGNFLFDEGLRHLTTHCSGRTRASRPVLGERKGRAARRAAEHGR
jgi:hypothetical protein